MTIDPNNLTATARLTFADEFDGLSLWNGAAGTWSSNWWYNEVGDAYATSKGGSLPTNAEQQWYVNANFAPTAAIRPWAASNGVLTLTADRASPEVSQLLNGYKFTSGMLNSWHSFSQQYGYFEISAKMPAGQGLWPAFWLLQKDGDWPPEIDVLEFLGQAPRTYHASIHTTQTGGHTYDSRAIPTEDLTAGYHRYGVDWQAKTITFYLDGRQVSQVPTPKDLHEPMYMVLNLAVGGYWPGSPDETTPFPAVLSVDYVRVYADKTTQAADAPRPPLDVGDLGGAAAPFAAAVALGVGLVIFTRRAAFRARLHDWLSAMAARRGARLSVKSDASTPPG